MENKKVYLWFLKVVLNEEFSSSEKIIFIMLNTMLVDLEVEEINLTHKDISSLTNISRPTVGKALKGLQKKGYIEIRKNFDNKIGTLPSTYKLTGKRL